MGRKQRKTKGGPPAKHAASRPRAAAAATANDAQQAAQQIAGQAAALLNRRDLAGASAAIERGLRLDPKNPDLLHLGGQVALYAGDVERGTRLIRGAIELAPKVALYHYNLAAALGAQNDLDGALDALRRTVRLDPKMADAFANLGIVFVRKDQQEDAEAAFSEAARLRPNDPQMHLNVAICGMELRHPDKVVAAVEHIERLVDAPDAALLHQIGNLYRGLGRHLVAEDYYRRSLGQDPGAAPVWFALGDVLAQAGQREQALDALDKAEAAGFEIGPIDFARARIASNTGRLDEAAALLEKAAQALSENIYYLGRIAHQYTLIGDFAAQERHLKRMLELDPNNIEAFSGLAFAPGRKIDDKDAIRLRAVADDGNVDANIRTFIGFALGDWYRQKKSVDESFKYYRLGNKLKGYSLDRPAYAAWVAKTEKLFSAEFFAARTGWGNPSRLPVLIVGMPRSGTTLTEQILSSHPDVHGAGEYGSIPSLCPVKGLSTPDFRRQPDLAPQLTREQVEQYAEAYLDRMRALPEHGESRVTNKLPHNFQHLGLFGLLFPEAPVVHIKRDPRDNLLSIYFQDFAGFHDYAYDLKTLGHYYRLYERLMAHWAKVVPNPVYELQYEDLVADLPGKTRELADFIGVDLDERMLRFWEQDRMVQTASKWQVRQPLYTSSVGRWKPYQRHLKPLFDVLGPID